MNSAKSIEKDVKVLKVKQSDEGMLDKSLEAKLVERQGKGSFYSLDLEIFFLQFIQYPLKLENCHLSGTVGGSKKAIRERKRS